MLEIVASTRSRGRAEAWSLALSSQEIANRVRSSHGVWQLSVEEREAARARAVIDAYERENVARPAAPEAPREYGPTGIGFALAAAILLFFLVTGPRDFSVAWFERGSGDAAAILAGELWRAATALTLHADFTHAFGNALACALFVTVVCRAYGPGAGSALILVSGIAGNLMNAAYHEAHHSSVGASTALFGAIGILAGMQFTRRRRQQTRRTRAWIPLAGGLGLLAMLGTGERADLGAHLFGLLAGAGLGAGAALWIGRPPGAAAQWLLGAGALATLSAAWLVALG
jgi:membrane associated rhomboid family serine protease